MANSAGAEKTLIEIYSLISLKVYKDGLKKKLIAEIIVGFSKIMIKEIIIAKTKYLEIIKEISL